MNTKKILRNFLFKILVIILILPSLYLSVLPTNVFADSCAISGSATFPPGGTISVFATGFGNPSHSHAFKFTNTSTGASSNSLSFTPNTTAFPIDITAPGTAGVYAIDLLNINTNFVTATCTTSLSGNLIDVQPSAGGGPPPPGPPPPGPGIRSCNASPTTLATGDTITITGSGFPPSTTGVYGYHFEPASLNNYVNTDSSGSFSHSAIVWGTGTFTVVAARGINPSSPEQLTCNTITVSPGASPPIGRGPLVSGSNPCGVDCDTAFGILSTDPTSFTGSLINIAIGIAGGIALIIMVRGAIKILMASGDPQKIQDGRDLMVAAVAGLLFLIFSVLIIRFLGQDLLGIF